MHIYLKFFEFFNQAATLLTKMVASFTGFYVL